MPLRHNYPFQPVRGTTAPSFSSSANTTAQLLALESTTLLRVWAGPSGRAVRVAESSGTDYFLAFGTSTIVAAGSSHAMLVLGGSVETFHIAPAHTYVSVLAIGAVEAEVNITLGYGE